MAKIRKIKERELIGGTSSTEVYPITHARAVYDKNNTPLSDTLEFLNTEIVWNNSSTLSNMNDFVVAGVYDIKGERTRDNDNLPILNTGGGHSFNARLTVLDSSISGSGNSDDKCITQVLSFSNRLGQGEVYIRTGKGSSLYNLTWENWSTLQRNVNVGEVGSLDDLKDNGIYSGVLTGTGETFVLVVINNYAVVGNNMPRSISQFKYSVNPLGTISFGKRVKIGDADFPAKWDILNKNEIDKMIEAAVSAAANYTDTAVAATKREILEGVDPDAIDSIKDIAVWIETHGGDVTAIYNAINVNTQRITSEAERATTAEANIKGNAMQYNTLGVNVYADKAEIYGRSINGTPRTYDIPAATTEKAGVMSAEDKKKLDNLSQGGGGDIPLATINNNGLMSAEDKAALEKTASVDDFEFYANKDTVTLEISAKSGDISNIELPTATTENAGVMSAADKEKLDNLTSGGGSGGGGDITAEDTDDVVENIEENLVSNALRKTPQVLVDSEKEQARKNIDAQKELTLTVKDNGNIVIGNINGQTKEFMPATPSGDPMHYAYIAAGAEYNDTDSHIVKDTPWKNYVDSVDYKAQWDLDVVTGSVQTLTYGGKSYEYVDDNGTWKIIARVGDKLIWDDTKVIHRKGYYYLNGLGDITEEQMMEIYDYTFPLTGASDWSSTLRRNSNIDNSVRTNILKKDFYANNKIKTLAAAFYNSMIEVVRLTGVNDTNWSVAMGANASQGALGHAIVNAKKVRYILGVMDFKNQKIDSAYFGANASSITVLRIKNLVGNFVSFGNSKTISKSSVLYIIQNAAPTSAITITLHADAYARLANDADIVAALAAQPLVTLVSA